MLNLTLPTLSMLLLLIYIYSCIVHVLAKHMYLYTYDSYVDNEC